MWFRGLVTAGLAVVMVANLAEGDWTWAVVTGLVLLLNAVGLVVALRARREAPGAAGALVGPQPTEHPTEDIDVTAAKLAHLPQVRAAVDAGPAVWEQVSYLDQLTGGAMPAAEALEHIHLTRHEGAWSLAVDDDLFPVLDLDVPEEADAALQTLRSHPGVADAWHEDREVYAVEPAAPLDLPDFAGLAVRAIVAHHLDAVRRLRSS